MATKRNDRTYPLQLKAGAAINNGLVTAYDFAGDPNNGYAGGDGAPHVGTWVLGKDTGAAFPVVTAAPGILGRDLSQGMRTDVRQAYLRFYADKLGIGSADGLGNFTLHQRYRSPAQYTGAANAKTLFSINDSRGARIRLVLEDRTEGYCYLYWELGGTTNAATNLPATADRAWLPQLRIPHNSVVDLHLVRSGSEFRYYINGALVATLTNDTWTIDNAPWTGVTAGKLGVTGATPADIIAIDHNYWNRALSPAEVQAHYSDPYAGYVSTTSAPVQTAPAAPTGLIASAGVNQVTVNATPGNDGGAAVYEYAVKLYRVSDNTVLMSGASATLPVVVTEVPAGSVYARMVARNSAGTSPESTVSNTVTVSDPATVPSPPTNVTATAGASSITVDGTPGSNGGSPITSYTARVYDADTGNLVKTQSSPTLPVTVTGLAATPVRARLVATNAVGDSISSSMSNTVTPKSTGEPPPPTGTPVRYDFPASYAIYAAATEPPSGITSVTVTPDAVTLEGGAVRQFNAAVAGDAGADLSVTWTATAGTVNAFGTFTAPSATTADQEILVRAASVQDPTKWDEATVVVLAVVVDEVQSVVVSPATLTAQGGSQVTFTAVVNGPAAPSQKVDWTATGGLINDTGTITLPQGATYEQTITVRATSALDPRKWGEAVVTIAAIQVEEVAGVAVSPAVANVQGGESTQFESEVQGPNNPSQAVTWTTTLGTINAEGVVTAPEAGPREQVGTVTATSVQDPTKKGTAVFVVAASMAAAFIPSVSRQVRILPGRQAFAVGSHWTLGTAGPVGSKDPNSAIDIPFDWSEWLADIGNPALTKIEFLLGGGLVSDGVVPNAKGGTVVVSGGSLQQTGTVTCRITTDTVPPRVEDRTVVLQMREQ